ncbi:MAG: glyoxalase [Chitinophagaceae bacterium]|nr:MAG: glyoxalase [Chitinophagaceae bacterium]
MHHSARSLRPFIGAKDYETSRRFYVDFGFEESVLSATMSVFHGGGVSFYLQNYYVQDWIDNTMLFMEVDDVDRYYSELLALDLPARYPGVRLTPIRDEDWGRECFLTDPSGVLWHFGVFR